jgi:hypothetical protein
MGNPRGPDPQKALRQSLGSMLNSLHPGPLHDRDPGPLFFAQLPIARAGLFYAECGRIASMLRLTSLRLTSLRLTSASEQ